MKDSRVKVAIIGGGASGLIAYCNARRAFPQGTSVAVFNEGEWGAGLAYQSDDPSFLLNVPAAGMSIFPEQPDDFVDWIRRFAPDALESPHYPFVPRGLFRRYLQARAGISDSDAHTRWVSRRVDRVRRSGGKWELVDAEGKSWRAEFILVATGYQVFEELPALKRIDPKRKMTCFEYSRLAGIPKQGNVLIIGSNLSAVDVWRYLRANGFAGKLTFVSRRGRVPFPHPRESTREPMRLGDVRGMTPRQILRVLRIASRDRTELALRAVELLRPQTQSIWTAWSIREKRQFFSHLRPYWETLRHRLPAGVLEEWEAEFRDGRSRRLAGRIESIEERGDGLCVRLFENGSDRVEELAFDCVVQATGPQPATAEYLSGGRIWTPAPLNLGFESLRYHGAWVIGPGVKGRVWEITAVPDIREQVTVCVADIAKKMQGSIKTPAIVQWFTKHPHDQGETYLQHFVKAVHFASILAKAAFRIFVHALVPFLYPDEGSNSVRELSLVLTRRRQFSFKTRFHALLASRRSIDSNKTRRAA